MGNSPGESSVGRERDGSDDKVDGGKWEITWGELRWEGGGGKRRQGGRRGSRGKSFGESSVGKDRRDGSDDKVDGGETAGNSLGRAPLGRGGVEATTKVDGGKPWEIAWGELQAGRKGNRGK